MSAASQQGIKVVLHGTATLLGALAIFLFYCLAVTVRPHVGHVSVLLFSIVSHTTSVFADHVEKRLEQYYGINPFPDSTERALIASNAGVECSHVPQWYSSRCRRDAMTNSPATVPGTGPASQPSFGPRMILPEHLNQLLEVLLPLGQIMLLHVRSPTEFEKAHVCGAINFGAPCSLVDKATLGMITKAIAGQEAQQTFSNWKRARCIVFHGRGLASRARRMPMCQTDF
ncbi:hypothetical protein CDD82_7651 [Ophiocordyceps australis]|uniref:Rhodanese domain-containing protein n=1 Tax=Ophiocordyceps australis TaxID=1399860 RepID=A0A2C5YPS7_9HYPO|nr:hypothetical protein CDD82_7651 [Ophiocordyceps australis]